MKDLVKMLLKKGFMLMILIFLIWLVFFLINYFYPKVFDFSVENNSSYSQTITPEEKIPFRLKIYNLFFKNSLPNPLSLFKKDNINDGSSTSINKNVSYIWGNDISSSSVILRDKNKLNPTDYYIYINDENNDIAYDFEINGNKIKKNGENLLPKGANISGNISASYLSSYYFSIYIYDANGNFLFSIPASGYFDLKDTSDLKIYSTNNNYSDYAGEGFMVIWTDNQKDVESVLISKIKIVI